MNAFSAVATGITVVVSQCVGRQAYKQARQASEQSIVICVEIACLCGLGLILFARPFLTALFGNAEAEVLESARVFLMFSAATMPFQALYAASAGILRALGDSKSPMFASFLANIAYLGVAYLMIRVLSLGVAGAAMGLAVSYLISSSLLFLKVMRGQNNLPALRLSLKPDMAVLRPVLRITIPAGVDSMLFNGGKLIVQTYLSGMGTAALAANSIAISLSDLANLSGTAMYITAMTVVGQLFGAGKIRETQRSMLKFTLLAMLTAFVTCSAMFFTMDALAGFYQPAIETMTLLRRVLTLYFVATPVFWSLSFVTPNALRATGDVTFTMTVSITSMFLFRVFGSWLFGVSLGWGLFGVWFAMILDWVCRGAFFLWRMLSGRWYNHGSAQR